MQTYEQACDKIRNNPRMNQAQRDDAYDDLRRRAARGHVKLQPCERCNEDGFIYDDGSLICENCGLEYGAES